MELSIIIPSRAGESLWTELLKELCRVLPPVEIVVSLACALTRSEEELLEKARRHHAIRVVIGSAGRAAQLNRGAAASSGRFLWFLHADTRMRKDATERLSVSLATNPGAIHFFKLAFYDGGSLMRITELGANFRSRILGIPFGDQGLCMPRDVFDGCGRYDERICYGEDHVLVWRARKRGVPVVCTGAVLETSAVKYATRGWGYVTAQHTFRTWKQALSEALKGPQKE